MKVVLRVPQSFALWLVKRGAPKGVTLTVTNDDNIVGCTDEGIVNLKYNWYMLCPDSPKLSWKELQEQLHGFVVVTGPTDWFVDKTP